MDSLPTVLIIGGRGNIGKQIAQDILKHTQAKIIVTGRTQRDNNDGDFATSRMNYFTLDLADKNALRNLIKNSDLVIHCAGPFHHRDGRVLKICLEERVNYLDVSDHRSFYQRVKSEHQQAEMAGVTAILNTGVFPGISNSMVRQGIEQLDRADKIQLNYVVSGSGGAGLTVMRTTFLGIKTPFQALINGSWKTIKPYTEKEVINFPQSYGKQGVYWFDVAETYTLTESFPVKTVITKFGSVPNFYNQLTWLTARLFPESWLAQSKNIEFLADVSYKMAQVTDRFSGVGIAMKVDIYGQKSGKSACYSGIMTHENTAVAAGYGTGSIAQFMLDGNLEKPGIYPVEQALSTELFEAAMKRRSVTICQDFFTN